MTNLESKTLYRDGLSSPIKHWAVWFRCPFGITSRLEEAIEACCLNELDPNRAIQPITVAIDETNRYEEVIR